MAGQIPSLPTTGIFQDAITGFRRICETINLLITQMASIVAGGGSGVAAAGTYEPTFLSGSVQYNNNGALGGDGSFQYGILLPNASGSPSRGILLWGAGQTQIVYITDEQLPGQKGINVIRGAGDASTTGAANWDGGDLLDFAGGTVTGAGGTSKYQGGTSVNGNGGPAILHGGNSTNGAPGAAIVQAGETGTSPGNCLYIATK